MNNQSKQQLLGKLAELRQRVAELEKALQEKESEATVLLQATSLGIHECDAEGRITFVNASQEKVTGYTAEELLGTYIWDRLEPGPEKDALPAYLKYLVGEQPPLTPFIGKNIRKNGERFVARVDWNYKRDPQGKVTGFVSIVSDITEQKRAEEELATSKAILAAAHDELERRVEERTVELTKANEELAIFRRFVDASGEGFGMATLDGHIVYVNPSMSRLLAAERPEDVIGNHLSRYFSEEHMVQREKEILPRILREGRWRGEIALSHQRGSVSLLQDSFLVHDEQGNPAYFSTVLTDITERKRADEALRQSRDELQTIYDEMVEGCLITDIETKRFVRVDSSMCQMLGYSEEEVLAASLKDIHPPEEAANDLQRFQAVADGQRTLNENRPVLRKDGSLFYADITGRRILYDRRPCVLALFRDVTERRQAQEALKREHHTIRHLLQSSDHERQLIAYEIHDGLAQYLAGAIMQFEVYRHLKESKPKQAAKAYDAGMTMLRQAHFEARRLISGVRPPILDESGIVAAIAHLVNEERQRNGPKIEFHSDVAFDRLVPILENAVYRIIQEGLTNACKHSKSQRVRLELLQQNDDLRIKIQDWGVGFNPSQVEEDCFGLPGIRERARLLGGKTTVESTPELGTCITVELPLVPRE